MAMVETATDGIALDKLDTHCGLNSLLLKDEEISYVVSLSTLRWIKIMWLVRTHHGGRCRV